MPSLAPPAPLAAEASHRPHTRARWATCAALMAAVLASACGGGGDDDNTPAPTPSPSPAPAPIATIDGYVGEWVSETCETFGDGSTRDVLRITRSSGDQMDVRLLEASYPGANCTGERQVANAVPDAHAERVWLAATESSGGLSFNRASSTQLNPDQTPVLTKLHPRSVWIAPQADRLCALDESTGDASGSFPVPGSFYPTAADVQAAYTQYQSSACFTRLASDVPGAALPLPAGENGERFLQTLFQNQNQPSVNSACTVRADGGSERNMWRYVALANPFRLQPEWGKAVFDGSTTCEGRGTLTVTGTTAPRRLHSSWTVFGDITNPYRVQIPGSDSSPFGLRRVHGVMYLRPGVAWPCDSGAQELFGATPTLHAPGPLLRTMSTTTISGCSAITPAP